MKHIDELEKTNIHIIDAQHDQITSEINNYYSGTEPDAEAFNTFIGKLSEMAAEHFITEEKLMRESKYENYYSHKMEHDRFLGKVKRFGADNKEELFIFLRDWLSNHFILKDKRLGMFLREQL